MKQRPRLGGGESKYKMEAKEQKSHLFVMSRAQVPQACLYTDFKVHGGPQEIKAQGQVGIFCHLFKHTPSSKTLKTSQMPNKGTLK